jgi:acetyltransferase-like isoleucine patch superfamily enzyme
MLIRRISNRILHLLAQFAPGAETVRPFLHKLRGVKIHGRVFIGDQVYLENEHPECIEIHDGAQIVLRSNLVCHFRGTGKIIIGKNAWIGMNCNIAASPGQTLTIGEGAVIAQGSAVGQDVAPYTLVGGVPARLIAKTTIPMTMYTDYHEWKKGVKKI